MKTVIIYYTFGGATKKEAERLSEELGAPAYRVREKRGRSVLGAFIPGCPQAINRKESGIQPLDVDLNDYDRIIIGSPIWGGFPAPAFNAIVDILPSGKQIDLFFCSGGGETPKSAEGTKTLIIQKGCALASYRDVCTGKTPSKMAE